MWKRIFSWRKEIPHGERVEMESALDAIFQPIKPRPQFVNELRRTLINYSMLEDKEPVKINKQDLIVIFASFFSAALLVSIGIRALITFIGAVGVIQYHRRQSERNQPAVQIKTTI